MKIMLETCNDGSFTLSNLTNQIRIVPTGTSYMITAYGHIETASSREKAFDRAISILTTNNVINIEGFIKHLETQQDVERTYLGTIYNIIMYGIKHECIAPNQFADWLASMIYGVTIEDVLPFINSYWLDDDYIELKNNQVFSVKEWVLANELWPELTAHVDMGNKPNLARGYRIEVQDMTGTKWLPIDIMEVDNLNKYFNDADHRDFYNANNCQPTGKICFIGYFRKTDDGYVPID